MEVLPRLPTYSGSIAAAGILPVEGGDGGRAAAALELGSSGVAAAITKSNVAACVMGGCLIVAGFLPPSAGEMASVQLLESSQGAF